MILNSIENVLRVVEARPISASVAYGADRYNAVTSFEIAFFCCISFRLFICVAGPTDQTQTKTRPQTHLIDRNTPVNHL